MGKEAYDNQDDEDIILEEDSMVFEQDEPSEKTYLLVLFTAYLGVPKF